MATQVSLNSGAVASAGALALQTNGTTPAVSISTGQVATLAQNPILTSGTENGVAYLNGSKVLTTGNALVFDGSNLGVGTASPASPLHITSSIAPTSGHIVRIDGTATTTYSGTGYVGGQIRINFTNATGRYSGINFSNTGASSQDFFGAVQNASGYNDFVWQGFSGSYLERMRLDSSGNLSIGATSTSVKLLAAGTGFNISGNAYAVGTFAQDTTNYRGVFLGYDSTGQIGTISANSAGLSSALAFWTYEAGASLWAERVRIDGSGNLLVGTTSSSGGGGSSGKMVVQFNGAATNGFFFDDTRTSAGTDNAAIFSRGTTIVGRLDTTLSSLALTNLSDQRVKTNIKNSGNSLGLINSLKVRQFDWNIDQTHEDFGFVAQELNEVLPQAVSIGKTEEEMWGVNYIKLVPILTKAIQEQQALITQLTARITALESA